MLGRFVYIAAFVVLATEGVAEEITSGTLWNHNGSVVSLYLPRGPDAPERQFYYRAPAAGLEELGVVPGRLLFDGRRNGNRYTGTAFVFSKCGALPYTVGGPVSADQRNITLYGKAPILNSRCDVIGHRDDTLVFNFSPQVEMAAGQTSANQTIAQRDEPAGEAVPYRTFLRRWELCFENGTNTDNIAHACDLALSYPQLTAEDRTKLQERRAALIHYGAAPPYATPNVLVPKNENFSIVINSPTETRAVRTVPVAPTQPFQNSSPVPIPLLILGLIFLVLSVPAVVWLRRPAQQAAGGTQVAPGSVPSQGSAANISSPTLGALQPVDLNDKSIGDYQPGQEPPSRSMSLKLRRSQRATVMGKIIFMLDARIGLNAEELALIKKYRLGGFVVYESKDRERRRGVTQAHLESTREHPSLLDGPGAQFLGLGKTLFRLGRASVSAAMTALSLRITVDSLMRGVHVECQSMDELLGAERAIREAADNLKGYLRTATTFDGQEEIVEL